VIAAALAAVPPASEPVIAARPRLERARLQLYNPKPGGGNGKAALGSRRDAIDFHFNPKELSLSKQAQWKRDPARDASTASPAQFTGADPSKLTVEMFFDETDQRDGSVAASVEKLLSCCNPTEETRGQKKASPPLVVFMWGQIVGFPSYIQSVSAKYTLFTSDGAPLRATCNVSLEELSGELTRQNPTSGALSVRRHHVVVAGDSLASLAYREYGDPGLWRALADFNGIDDPMRLPAGTELLLPAPDDFPAPGV
jgi:nucleoid-associated protein YgaU